MQQLNQINIKDSVGKVIKNVEVSLDELCIVFEDNSFSYFKKYQDWDLDLMEDFKLNYNNLLNNIRISENNTPYLPGDLKILVKAGVIDPNQLITDGMEIIRDKIKQKEDHEKQQLEKLLKKYPKCD